MKIKNLLKMTVAALLVSGLFTSNAMAASTTGTADALVVTPITIGVGGSALSFGGIVGGAGTPAGNVAVDVFGVRLSALQLVSPAGSVGTFDVVGDPNRAYNLIHSTTSILSGPGDPMTANLFSSRQGNLSALGTDEITMFGNLDVGAAQAPGSYTGTFNMTVDY